MAALAGPSPMDAASAAEWGVADWVGLIVRWLHLIAGIAWIGASFYFIHLDTA